MRDQKSTQWQIKQKVFFVDFSQTFLQLFFELLGSGYESMAAYKNTKITFLGIENIHVVRGSLKNLFSLCVPNSRQKHDHWLSNVESTHWLDHIKAILEGMELCCIIDVCRC